MKRPNTPAPERPSYQAIQPGELLPLPVVKQRLRWGDETISKAQREGLKVLRYGKWGYVVGADLIEFLSRLADKQAGDGNGDEQGGNG